MLLFHSPETQLTCPYHTGGRGGFTQRGIKQQKSGFEIMEALEAMASIPFPWCPSKSTITKGQNGLDALLNCFYLVYFSFRVLAPPPLDWPWCPDTSLTAKGTVPWHTSASQRPGALTYIYQSKALCPDIFLPVTSYLTLPFPVFTLRPGMLWWRIHNDSHYLFLINDTVSMTL